MGDVVWERCDAVSSCAKIKTCKLKPECLNELLTSVCEWGVSHVTSEANRLLYIQQVTMETGRPGVGGGA